MTGVQTPERLRDGADIVATLRRGRHRAGRLVVVYVRDRDDARPSRAAVVASRKVGSAVSRNRAKRLLREAARLVEWRDGQDVVLVARRACAGSGLEGVAAETRELADVLQAAGHPAQDQP